MSIIEKGYVVWFRLQGLHHPERLPEPVIPLAGVAYADEVDPQCSERRNLLREAAPVAKGLTALDARIQNINREARILER